MATRPQAPPRVAPGTPPGLLERHRLAQAALFLVFALAVRFPAFGEWNYAVDDQFFALVGHRMLAGDLLYVDIWDRKPPLLYLTYAAIAWVDRSVIAYQLVATLFAALGSYATARTARLVASFPAAIMAGLAYCALLTRFGGANGEAAVFYNPLMIAAVWSIASSLGDLARGQLPRRVLLGMVCAGLAIAYKQSALFEAGLLGIAPLVLLARGGMAPRAIAGRALVLAALGALPMVVIGLFYASIGHFPEAWQAMVQSNFARAYDSSADSRLARALALLGLLVLPLALAAAGYLHGRSRIDRRGTLDFLGLWALIAIAALAVFPSLYLHYALPLVAPLAVLSAPFFAQPRVGPLGFAALVLINLATADTFDLATRSRAGPAAAALVEHLRQATPHGRLLVWGMPSYLYAEIGTRPPSVIAFPAHFYEGAEHGASGRDEVAELRRVLREGPETVVVQEPIPARPVNAANAAQVTDYLRGCAAVKRMTVYDHDGAVSLAVFNRCAGR